MAKRTCLRCRIEKEPESFYRQAARRDGLHIWCKDCCREYNRSYSQRPHVQARRHARSRVNEYDRQVRVQWLYGLSPETYEALLARQGHGCAICRTDMPGGRWGTWHVDHDHRHCPGIRGCAECVRGLLCNNCNLALGHLHHDLNIITAAAAYAAGQQRLVTP